MFWEVFNQIFCFKFFKAFYFVWRYCCCLVAKWCLTLWRHGLQHTRTPCASPSPQACSNPCPLSQWCHPTSSSFVVPFSSCLQSFPVSGSFPVSQFFASGDQSIGISASASVLPMNIQGWFPLDWLLWSPCSPSVIYDLIEIGCFVMTSHWASRDSAKSVRLYKCR